ncbi:TPA: carbon starvation protein CstA [Clostridium botulinum]|uniref:Carbon starvation protein CstA n=1 Tax=Clostridium botulinum TaxID=1491 RepID=A0AA44BPA3_CLOBO|nr:hypothetical protein [Clostridium botulinum]AUN17697.1 carbon starvation protein CstA [Clostridium botulinum]MBN3409013.1 carbon starvation protein CstA [Clostridium botulinum]MBY6872200.1 carbon starvation protein CstA [Clostridium botulinum]MBY6886933.1 carbon starvation protein CstA [Clostridium botulinum]NFA97270.1 carbon starvation protein CstA [Clostridium botulinum]
MSKSKRIFSSIVITVMTMVMGISTNAYAKDNIEEKKDTKDKIVTEYTITDTQEIQKYCEKKQLPYIENGKPVSKISFIKETEKDTTPELQITPRSFTEIYEEEYPIQWTGSQSCGMSRGQGPGTLSLSTSYTETATVTTNFGYNTGKLSAAVGFNVSTSYTITPNYNISLSAGQYATIYAYPIYKGSYFKVTNVLNGSVKYGTAYRPFGTEYEVVYR